MSRLYETNDHVFKPFVLALCIVLLCIAAILRFSHLGDKDFGIDEILHVYVAQELLKGNPPLLPSGYAYERSLPFSYLVAIAGFLGGFGEFALRIPSAILGVVVVFFVYWLTRRWFSVFAGLVAAFLTAFSPIEIAHSREVRMYMLFQLLFLLTVFFFYEGFETASPIGVKKLKPSVIQKWSEIFQIRPFFLLCAGGTFFLALSNHALIFPAISGLLIYVLAMGVIGLFTRSSHDPIRQKYIGSCLLLIFGAFVGSLVFPEKLAKLGAFIREPLDWGQDNADNWSYYRWLLLDEYPILFGGLAILLLCCLLKNPNIGLFVSCTFLLPVILHSLIFPMKSYRYILHVLPFMYIAAGVGFSELLSYLWSAGKKLNEHEYVPRKLWNLLLSCILCIATLGTLVNMPWFMRTLKDYATNFHSPHVTDVQHHNWKNAVQYLSEHQTEGDVIISGYPLLNSYYGATQPLYFMNNAYLLTNIRRNLKNENGELIDYTFGSLVLKDLNDLKQVLKRHSSGWVMTHKWRKDLFWNYPDIASTHLGSFRSDVRRYLQDHFESQEIPNAPDIALWRWKTGSDFRSEK